MQATLYKKLTRQVNRHRRAFSIIMLCVLFRGYRLSIDLTIPVFSHGQLYMALSQVRNQRHVRIRLKEGSISTVNVTVINNDN